MNGRSLLLSALLVTATGALLLGQDQAPARNVDLILTRGTGPLWKPFDEAAALPHRASLGSAVDAAKAELPGALLVDLGDFTVPMSSLESAYNAPVAEFFAAKGYAGVHVTGRDFLHYGIHGTGLNLPPPGQEGLFLTNLDDANRVGSAPIASKSVGGGSLRVISVSNFGAVTGLDAAGENIAEQAPEEVIGAALLAGAEPSVLLSDYPAARNDEFATLFPALDVIVETGPAAGSRRTVGDTHLLPAPAAGEVARLRLSVEGDRVAEATLASTPVLAPDALESLATPPLPVIGMSVQPPSRVAERFNVPEEHIHVDVIRGASFPAITPRKDIFVYFVDKDGESVRFYRVNTFPGRGWIPFDGLVVIDNNRTVTGIVTNMPTYPVFNLPTRFGEVIAGISGKPPAEWEIDPALIAGYEDQAAHILDTLRKTLELDALLYPE